MTTRVALVTGAGDRIGATFCRRLALDGWAVVVHYRHNAEGAKSVVRDVRALGGRAAAVRADLGIRRARAGLIARAAAPFGPLTLLVNNASTYEHDSIADVDEALWDAHFSVHAEAPVFLARDFSAQLPEGVVGNIVNILDERVLHLSPAHFSYTLSKSLLATATRLLAQSLAPRIRVNAIAPGLTLANERQKPDAFAAAQQKLPLGVGATPDELADALAFLLAAPSMTGVILPLDGGQHLEWPDNRGPTPRRK